MTQARGAGTEGTSSPPLRPPVPSSRRRALDRRLRWPHRRALCRPGRLVSHHSPAFLAEADITVREECPRTIPGLPFKGMFANMGSLGSWTRPSLSQARPCGRGKAEAAPRGPQPAGLPPAFLHLLFPSQPLRAVGSRRPAHADPSVTGSCGVSLGRASCSKLSPACAHRTMLPPPFPDLLSRLPLRAVWSKARSPLTS